jgi:hypothetical protein
MHAFCSRPRAVHAGQRGGFGGGFMVMPFAFPNFLARAIRLLCTSTASGFTATLLASPLSFRPFLRQNRLNLCGQRGKLKSGAGRAN